MTTTTLSLFNVHLADGNVTTVLAPTSQAAYAKAVAAYPANQRPLSTAIVPKRRTPSVPVWFVEEMIAKRQQATIAAEQAAERQARLDAEAIEAAATAAKEANLAMALPIPPCPAKRNLFTLDLGTGPALGSDPSLDEAERIMTTEALMGATTQFDWSADENGFNAYGYRSGFHLV